MQKVSTCWYRILYSNNLTLADLSNSYIIFKLLVDSTQLTWEDLISLPVVSLILAGQCLNASIKMLSTDSIQYRAVVFIKKYVLWIYSNRVTRWIMTDWKVIDDQHLQSIKHIMYQTHLRFFRFLTYWWLSTSRLLIVSFDCKRIATCLTNLIVLICLAKRQLYIKRARSMPCKQN